MAETTTPVHIEPSGAPVDVISGAFGLRQIVVIGDATGANLALVNGRLPVDGSGVTQPVSAVALPLPAGAATEATLLLIKTDVDKIPSQGQALAAGSMPVVLTAAQVATLTPPSAITGFSTEATLALIKAKTDNLDTLLSSRTKPADQQHVIVDTVPTTTVTGPLTDTQLRNSAVPVSLTSVPTHAVTGPLTDTQLRASDVVAALTGSGSLLKKSVAITTNTSTVIVTAGAQKIRLYKFGYSSDGGNAAGTRADLSFGANAAVDKQWLDPKQPYADGLTNRYVDGAVGEDLKVICTVAPSVGVYVNVLYQLI